MVLSIAEQIILHSTSDKQALQKAGLLCCISKKDSVTDTVSYYFKDESLILTRWNEYEIKYEIVEVMDGEE